MKYTLIANILRTAFSIACLLVPFSIFAVKAKPGILEVRQNDGSVVKIMLHGDEKFHYATDSEDILVVQNQDGEYEYAVVSADGTPVASGIPVRYPVDKVRGKIIKGSDYDESRRLPASDALRSQRMTRAGFGTDEPKYQYSSASFPTSGHPRTVIVLVEYQDVKFNVENPREYFNELLNGEDFTRDGASGSCYRYFMDNSGGNFSPKFDVYGPVLLSEKRSYYGSGIDEPRACMMVVEAVKALDEEIDFTIYDNNGDGFVDCIYVFYADMGEADGGPRESVWPYSWELLQEGVLLTADGVKFNTYGCSNELQADGEMNGIGTFLHEFGHVLGLPDLYNTENGYDRTTPSSWSIMDEGSYNNDSRTPPNFSSFERYSLGWLKPEEITQSGTHSLEYLATSNQSYILTSKENPDEFFMLENRQQQGWDSFLPYHGMLVWHIDFNQQAWDDNVVNNDRNHQMVELVRADGAADKSSLKHDVFPGQFFVDEFSVTTNPALLTVEGQELNVTSIYEIREEEGNITFRTIVSEEGFDAGMGLLYPDDSVTVEDGILFSKIETEVYDIAGRKVGRLVPGRGLRLPPGLYIASGKKIFITH